ncbi:MAG: hypothetical protein AAGA56_01745 [Myxococcota bacterium]
MRLPYIVVLFALAGVTACASGIDEVVDEDNDAEDDVVTTTTTTDTEMGTGEATPTTATDDPMEEECEAPDHLCGGICVGNTPDTGCTESADCLPCPTDPNGMAVCSDDGYCEIQCTAPFVDSGGMCECPTECCGDADCTTGTCQPDGTCGGGSGGSCAPGSADFITCTGLCLLLMDVCNPQTCLCSQL